MAHPESRLREDPPEFIIIGEQIINAREIVEKQKRVAAQKIQKALGEYVSKMAILPPTEMLLETDKDDSKRVGYNELLYSAEQNSIRNRFVFKQEYQIGVASGSVRVTKVKPQVIENTLVGSITKAEKWIHWGPIIARGLLEFQQQAGK